MAFKLYKEDGQSNPAWQYVDEAVAPSGYTATDDPIDWDVAFNTLLGIDELDCVSAFRDKINLAYIALGAPSAAQKEIASKWFVIDKSVRDTVHSALEQGINSDLLVERMITRSEERKEENQSAIIAAADKIAIDEVVTDQVSAHGMKTGVYTGDGTTSQSIVGIGFKPKYVKIQEKETTDSSNVNIYFSTDKVIDDNASGLAIFVDNANAESKIGRIKSLDSDGFTVGDSSTDSHPNKTGTEYNYIAFG